MMTKDKIVERLLDNKAITTKEAVVLLRENQTGFKQFPSSTPPANGKVPYHTICGCDVCYCIVGNKMVDPESSGGLQKMNTHTTSSTDTFNQVGCPRGGTLCFCDGSCKK